MKISSMTTTLLGMVLAVVMAGVVLLPNFMGVKMAQQMMTADPLNDVYIHVKTTTVTETVTEMRKSLVEMIPAIVTVVSKTVLWAVMTGLASTTRNLKGAATV
jgi:hypothetical protein